MSDKCQPIEGDSLASGFSPSAQGFSLDDDDDEEEEEDDDEEDDEEDDDAEDDDDKDEEENEELADREKEQRCDRSYLSRKTSVNLHMVYLVCMMANLVFGVVYLEFATISFVPFAIPPKMFPLAWTFFIAAVVMSIFKPSSSQGVHSGCNILTAPDGQLHNITTLCTKSSPLHCDALHFISTVSAMIMRALPHINYIIMQTV